MVYYNGEYSYYWQLLSEELTHRVLNGWLYLQNILSMITFLLLLIITAISCHFVKHLLKAKCCIRKQNVVLDKKSDDFFLFIILNLNYI